MNNLAEIIAGDVNISKKERIVSIAGGIALVALGIIALKKKSAASWSELAAGAALLIRGATGHCPVSAALNRNTAADELAEDAEEKFTALAE